MKKSNEYGITLIALVVTIIILLILAGVTVGVAMNGSGLFDKAKYATELYQNKQEDEEKEISKITNSIDEYIDSGYRSATTKKEMIYNGGAISALTTHDINGDIKDYDLIIIETKDTSSNRKQSTVFYYDSELYDNWLEINQYDTKQLVFKFLSSDKKIEIGNSAGLAIYRIIGIKL